jgi:hypothetical protein
MSGEASNTTDALLKRISQLEGDLAAANSEAAKRRKAFKAEVAAHAETKAQLATITTDRDNWKSKVEAGPNGLANQVAELQGKLDARDHSDAFLGKPKEAPTFTVKGQDGKEVKYTLNEGVSLNDVWDAIKYTAKGEVPDAAKVTAAFQQAQGAKPYLFKVATGETPAAGPGGHQKLPARPPLESASSSGRGVPDTNASRLRVTKSQLQDPRWKLDPRNSKAVAEAQKNGTLDIIDG